MDSPGIDKRYAGLQNDIRSGIDSMRYIHELMLQVHTMKHIPKKVNDEYYRDISRTAVKRAELESTKIALDSTCMELELKRLDLQIMKINEEKKNIAIELSDDSDESNETFEVYVDEIEWWVLVQAKIPPTQLLIYWLSSERQQVFEFGNIMQVLS